MLWNIYKNKDETSDELDLEELKKLSNKYN